MAYILYVQTGTTLKAYREFKGMMFLFILGIVLLVVSSIAVSKVKNKTQHNLFVVGVVIGFLLVGLGFSAFTPNDNEQTKTTSSDVSHSEQTEEKTHYETDDSTENNTSDVQPVSTSFESDYEIESFLKDNTKYTDVSVSGTYINKPFGAVITVNVDDTENKAQVVSNVLRAFHENADDKLDDFYDVTVMVDDSNKRLKAAYDIGTVMNNASIYRTSKMESLASSWSVVPSPNK